MANRDIELNGIAQVGFDAPDGKCPHLATSINADAWTIGKWLRLSGRTSPRYVRKSRGDTYWVNEMKVRISYGKFKTEIERIS